MGRAICKILDDPERARQFGETSLKISQEHSEEATFDSYEMLYKQLLAEEARNRDRQ
jgi:hypothetical protein